MYYQGAEVGTEIIDRLRTYNTLTWDSINIHLSFCNLGDRGNMTRLQWLWGRTSWVGVAPFWEYKQPSLCAACHTVNHPLDLFSTAALCSKWEAIRTQLQTLWNNSKSLVTQWFNSATEVDKRNFVRSLIPTSLVNYLRKVQSPLQIQALVNRRDTQWKQGTHSIRTMYNPTYYSIPSISMSNHALSNDQQDALPP